MEYKNLFFAAWKSWHVKYKERKIKDVKMAYQRVKEENGQWWHSDEGHSRVSGMTGVKFKLYD